MRLRRLLAIVRDRTGVAAIEFALVLPVMVLMFCGTFEVSQAIIVYMKVIDVADTVSDLVAQQSSVASSDLSNYYIAGQMVMTPSSGSGLGVAIASVTFDATTGNPTVQWQVTRGTATPMTDAATAAIGLGSPGDSVIVAQANYTYTSLLKYVIPTALTMSSRVFSRPRLVAQVACPAPCN